ncbi:hypothetical protein QBC38DRAFT_461119 [Podospora fimiseda]|uniref:Uncharacterized protein n=1 Tax=Podospora fimiseda TaxID=252190 RepID=A0AAN6YMC7_9PEZI|nr:hypothetical protein QBC38DRAFT_461119 [Podospora fimiseda]
MTLFQSQDTAGGGVVVAVEEDYFWAKSQEQLNDMLVITDNVLTKVAQRKVLSVLAFPEMRSRRDLIDEAHNKAYTWIFDKLKPYNESWDWKTKRAWEQKVKLRKSADEFLGWLAEGDGVFHISGKLGSGKSTLMKYLCRHE